MSMFALAVIMAGLALSSALPWPTRAAASDQAVPWSPTACQGWDGGSQAERINLSAGAPVSEFSQKNSAVFIFRPSRDGEFGTVSPEATLRCNGFSGKGLPRGSTLTKIDLVASMGGLASIDSGDVVVPEFSLDDGATWQTLPTILMRGTFDNRSQNGYWRQALPGGIVAADLQHLSVRFRYVDDEDFTSSTVLLDGIRLDLRFEAGEQSGFISRFFSITESPVVVMDSRSLKNFQLLDASGRVVDAPLVTEVVNEGMKVSLQPGYRLPPGQYVVRAQSKRFFQSIVQEARFSFGLANLNTAKSTYTAGEVMPFAMSVLNEAGKTICNAEVTLTVRKPDGAVITLRTADGSIARSNTCGPASLTNQPDFSASLIADQAGRYQATMAVNDGVALVRAQLAVDATASPQATVERLGPSRINPKAPYVERIRVTTAEPYRGTVEESVPQGFILSDLTPDAKIEPAGDRQTVRWTVDWEAKATYELSYTFDAPDESPVLYQLGPFSAGKLKETRTWTIASDETIRREKPDVAFESIKLTPDDWSTTRDALTVPTKPSFLSTENAHIKVYKSGFDVPASKRDQKLRSDRLLTVTKVSVKPKNNPETLAAVQVSEQFSQGGQEMEMLHLVPTRAFRPGLYQIETTLTDGQNTVTETTEFAWGVLAINTPKSVYLPGEQVDFGMGFVSPEGHTICNADMTLIVTNPKGEKVTLTTADGSVVKRAKCADKEVTNDPDYSARITAGEAGDYDLELTGTSDTGTRTVHDILHVRAEIPVEITRVGATRIYPGAMYQMTLKVIPFADYKGPVEDRVPATYQVSEISDSGTTAALDERTTAVRWDVNWKAGETHELSYRYDPEDVSPALFLMGPLQVGDFTEYRQWQIASDATDNLILFFAGDTIPDGWTCVSCNSEDFVDRLIRGAATYAKGASSTTTHTHTVSWASSTSASGTISTNRTAAAAFGGSTHRHNSLASGSTDAVSMLPPYRQIKVIRYDTTGTPASIPNGAIGIFESAPSAPWLTRYSNQDGKFLYGQNGYITETGAETHTHTVSINTGVPGTTAGTAGAGASLGGTGTHNHTGSTATASGSNLPPYIDVLLYQTGSATTVPTGLVAMWDDTPVDTNWTVESGASQTYNGYFLRGNTPFGATGGATTHTHSNATITTGSPLGTVNNDTFGTMGTVTNDTHTHNIGVSFADANNLPPYVDVIIAEYTPVVTITVSGTCDQFDQTTDCVDESTVGDTVKIAVDGSVQAQTDATVDGAWSIASVTQPASGAVITVFVDGTDATYEAVAVTKYDGTGDIDLIRLYQRHLTIGTDTGSANDDQTITNANLGAYDNVDDEDLMQSVTSDDLIVDDDGAYLDEELTILAGDTFRPNSAGGADVTTTSVELAGVWTADSNAINVAGDWVNSGTFTAGTSTLTLNGTAAQALTTNSQAFSALTINNTGASGTTDDINVTGALDVDGTLTITDGDLDLAESDPNVTTASGVSIGTNGLVTKPDTGSPTWTFDGSGTSTWTDSAGTTQDLGLVSIDGTTKTVNLGSSARATKVTLGADDTFGLGSSGYTLTITGSGTGASQPFTVTAGGTLNEGTSSTVDFIGTSASDIELETYNSLSLRPGADSVTFTLDSGTFNVTGNLTVGNGTNTGTVNADTNDPTFDVDGNVTIAASGTLVASGTGTFTVGGNWDNNGTFTHSSATVTFDASDADNTIETGSSSFQNLTLAGTDGSGTWTYQTDSGTVAAVLNVDTDDILTIASSISLTLSATTGTTLTLNGTINGSGTLVYSTTTNFPTSGTISSALTFDATGGNMTIPDRTAYGGNVEFYSYSTSNRTATLGTTTGQTLDFSGNVTVNAANSGHLTVTAATWNSNINIAGTFDNNGSSGTGAEIPQIGSGTWTVSGSFTIDTGTCSCNSGTIVLNGSGTFTFSGLTVNNLSISGAYTSSGNFVLNNTLDMTGGTVAYTGLNTVSANGTNTTIKGGGQTIPVLNVGDGSDTLTISTSDLEVTSWLDVNANATVNINDGITMTLSRNEWTSLYNDGTINGPGRLTYKNSATTFPTTGALGSTLITRFDTVNGNLTIPARTDYGLIEAYGASANDRTVTLGTAASPQQTITTAGNFYVIADGGAGNDITLQGATYDPILNVGGDFDFTGTSDAIVTVTAPNAAATWTVAGNVDLTNGQWTASAETLKMTGTKNLTAAGQTIANVTIDGTDSTVTITGSDLTVSGTLTVGGTDDSNNDTLSIAASRTVTSNTTGTVTLVGSGTDTISGDGTLTVQNSNLGTGGTLSSVVKFDATSGNINLPARTYGGAVTVTDTGALDRTATALGGTLAFSSTLDVNHTSSGVTTLELNTNNPDTTITGALTIGSGDTLSANSANALNINGNYTNNGTFTHNSGTVTLAGAAQQTLSGTMTGGSAFNALTITNAWGSDPDTSPSVIFSTAATADTFTAATASVKLRFAASTTYTFTNINFNGQATGTRVALRSSSAGTQWTLASSGTHTVSNTDVKDSNATVLINASESSNLDSGNNTNWLFGQISVSLSSNTIDFGSLALSTITKGSVTSTVTAVAANGYRSYAYYSNPLQIDGSHNIDDATGGTIVAGTDEEFGAATSDSGNDIAAWSPASCTTGAATSNATALTTSPQTFASASGNVTNDATTLCLMAAILPLTASGNYSTTITIVTVGKF